MYLIEGHWEILENLYDVSKVIREYYNPNLANRLDELIEQVVISKSDAERLEELEETIESIRRIVW